MFIGNSDNQLLLTTVDFMLFFTFQQDYCFDIFHV